jgi:hypothetical protein
MGLIKEPKNVDFTVLDKPWTVEDRKELSTFIKLSKEQRKKNTAKSKRGKSNLNTNIPSIVSLAIVWLTENL